MSEPTATPDLSSATPMLRQYLEAKAQPRVAPLIFRLGVLPELFFDVARVASQILGITLTSRAKGDERVPMASFYTGNEYLYRLVKMLAGGS